jgi:hypothetical protein
MARPAILPFRLGGDRDSSLTGIAKLFAALKESPSVLADDPISVIRVVLQGAVVTYIRNSWGNAASAVSASDVKSARRQFLKYPD